MATTSQPPLSTTDVLTADLGTSLDGQSSQTFSGIASVRTARLNLLQRKAAVLTARYSATDPRVVQVQAKIDIENSVLAAVKIASDNSGLAKPKVPAGGWVLYGHVLDSNSKPVPKQTVILANEQKQRQAKYGYAFSDATGYFELSYEPPASGSKAKAAASAFIQVLDSKREIVFIDTQATALTPDTAIYRDLSLTGGVLGTPPGDED